MVQGIKRRLQSVFIAWSGFIIASCGNNQTNSNSQVSSTELQLLFENPLEVLEKSLKKEGKDLYKIVNADTANNRSWGENFFNLRHSIYDSAVDGINKVGKLSLKTRRLRKYKFRVYLSENYNKEVVFRCHVSIQSDLDLKHFEYQVDVQGCTAKILGQKPSAEVESESRQIDFSTQITTK